MTSPHTNSKMLAIFLLNKKFNFFYDNMSVLPLDIQAFLKQFNVKLLIGNDTFSYFFLNNGFLHTFSKLRQGKILCSESYDQKLLNTHFKITADILLTLIRIFISLYKHKIRSKRSDFITEIFSSFMFTDKQDLQKILDDKNYFFKNCLVIDKGQSHWFFMYNRY